jgi:transcriptional regulator with XRE-family HTH domain
MTQGIGEKLRARARELALTDAEVARRLGLAQSRYAHYVSGTREPDFRTLQRICKTLGVSPDYLLGFCEETDQLTSEQEILQTRAMLALRVMGVRDLRLAADLLDVIAQRQDVEKSASGAS